MVLDLYISMTNTLRRITLVCLLIVLCEFVVSGKEWRSIVPLKSTRADVERILGAPQKTSFSSAYYSLPGEIVVVDYQVGKCEDHCGLGWNVREGTVVAVGVIPKGNHRKEEYLTAGNFNVSNESTGLVYYTNAAEGLSIETYKSVVTLVDYYPSASEETLRCLQPKDCIVDLFTRFDEYGKLPFADEKARLDNYSIQLNATVGRGGIEVRGPNKKERAALLKSAARAKAYLVTRLEIEPERILIFDGGYSPVSFTRLSLYAIGGFGSAIYFSPEPDPVSRPAKKR
jgi:hypothetical protein